MARIVFASFTVALVVKIYLGACAFFVIIAVRTVDAAREPVLKGVQSRHPFQIIDGPGAVSLSVRPTTITLTLLEHTCARDQE